MMRAIVVERTGERSSLRLTDVPEPTLGPGDLRIAVASAGINRADLLQRRGLYPPPPGASDLLGLECAGRVVEIGREVTGWSLGDRSMALLTGGGYAESVVVPAGCAMPVPDALDDIAAGAVPEVFLTAFLNLFLLGGIEAGQTVLVHGGSGGVGTAAIALCRHSGVRVLVTAGSPERCERCRELGADAAFDHTREDWKAGVLKETGGRGVEVVLDCIGAPYLAPNLSVLRSDGRLVLIGSMGGTEATISLRTLLAHRLTVIGSTLRSRPVDAKARIVGAFLDRFGGALARGEVAPEIGAVFPLSEAEAAHRLMSDRGHFGKIVLTVAGMAVGS